MFDGLSKDAMKILIAGIACLFAADGSAATITLPDAVKIALEKSPDVRAIENQLESAHARKRQALAPAEPSFQATSQDMLAPFKLSAPTSTVYQISQTIGFPGRALLNRAALSEQAQAVGAQLKSMRLQVSANVKQAYYGLAFARKNIELNSEQRNSYERILAIAKRRYEAGAITQVNILNAQTTLYSNDNDLSDLLAAEKQARGQLNVLLGNPPEQALEVDPLPKRIHPKVDFDKALQTMVENRAEIQAAKHQANASEKTQKLAYMSLLPDFQLAAGTTFYNVPGASPLAGFMNNAPEANHTYMAQVSITIPIWGFFNEREGIIAATHDWHAAEASLDALFNQSKVALQAAVESLESLRKKIENSEQRILPLSEQSFSLALTNYSSGKIDFQTLQDTATARRGYKRDYASNLVNYLNTYTTYGQLIGEDL